MGSAIATVVNVAVPPMPVSSLGPLENRIRSRLAGHLDGLADWLRSEVESSSSQSPRERQVLTPLLVELWDATDRTAGARRINPRARWHKSRAARQYEDVARLEQLIYLGQEIGELVGQGMGSPNSEPCLDDEARHGIAGALAELSHCLRWADVDIHARRDDLGEASRRLRDLDGLTPKDNDWVLTSIVMSIRRSLQIPMLDGFKQ